MTKVKKAPKVPASPMPKQEEPLAASTPPQQNPDPEIVNIAWAVNMWRNRLKNAKDAITEIDKNKQYVLNEIEQIKLNLSQQERRLVEQTSYMGDGGSVGVMRTL